MNIPNAGRAPSNEPEPVKVCGIEVVPDPSMKLLCGNCDYHVKSGPMNYCPQCGAALLARFRWVPPPSQEACAASTGQTRTK